ncbi:MAG: heavy metal-binding domain-containing protein [Solirubrobacteraceae bacterium]
MGFLHRRGADADLDVRDADPGLSEQAQERLEDLSGAGAIFTSGLSVNEFALLRGLGPTPLAQVMGASVVRTGWQYLPALEPGIAAYVTAGYGRTATLRQDRWGNAFGETSGSQIRSYLWATPVVCRLETISDGWNLARRRALARLTDEAMEVGADAVVGVSLQRADHDLGRRTVEYAVNGTAVRSAAPGERANPVLTDLSVQEYTKLIRAGQEPVGLVATTVAVFASPSRDTRIKRVRTFRSNQELTELSRAFQLARDSIRQDLRDQITRAGGAGVVGVELSQSIHREKLALASALRSPEQQGWGRGRLGLPYYVSGRMEAERRGWVITMHAAGTAIRPHADGASQSARPTEIRLRL